MSVVSMLLSRLASTSDRLSRTRSRLEKVSLLADCLRSLQPAEITAGVSYLMGRLPQGRIGLGAAALHAAEGGGSDRAELTLGQVDEAFEGLRAVSGAGASARRRQLLAGLFARATADEQDFLVRLVMGELRQGAVEGLMVEAVAKAAGLSAGEVRRAAMLAGDLAEVAQAALADGAAGLARFRLQLLQPVRPMLAQGAEDVGEALDRLGIAALEYKLDGARLQVHKAGESVAAFSRALNDVSAAVPEVIEAVRALPVASMVLDGEAIALRADGRPHPFQVTMRRFGRRLEVDRLRAELPLAALFFDCLHVDGEDLIDRPGDERFDRLAGALPSGLTIPRLVTREPLDAQAFLDEALRRGHEGVMAKSLQAPYEAGSRGSGWLKIKSAHTLDLVVLAAEWGHGRRAGWLSNLHLGARHPAGGFVMLGKTFKGMTDDMLSWQTRHLLALKVSDDGHVVHVRPELVVEVAFNDVQASPQYPGGYALRFARVKGYRPDKHPDEADTIETVRTLHPGQSTAYEKGESDGA